MRILIALTAGTVLLSVSTATLAKDRGPVQRDETPQIERIIFNEQVTATLTASPYYLEIQKVIDQSKETERVLLAELQTITDEAQAVRIVGRLERLEFERELDVLNIQARYAHSGGMLDLERKIRARILDLMEEESGR